MREFLRNQLENQFLWLPFLMAAGGAFYFTAPFEPSIILLICLGTIMCAMILFWRRVGARALMCVLFGFLYAAAYTHIIWTPGATRPIRDVNIHGIVTDIDYTPNAARIYLRTDDIYVRIKTDINNTPAIGDEITGFGNLYPMTPAYAPETFDYARWAYFNNLGATGTINEFTILNHNAGGINNIRDYIHKSSDSFLTDSLVLGYKNTLDKDTRAIWATNGIAHVWSISGFHMTLVMGWLFAFFFMIFRCIPYLTRRIPARIPATLCASVGLAAYLIISGGGVATVRAFMMAILMVAAFVIGRSAITMRNICIVFAAMFLINPHNIMSAGFQLSFAAVFGLVWFWGGRKYVKRTRMQRFLFIIYAAIMTSLVATIFTAPFVAAHFYLFPTYGLIGNLVLLPMFSLLIMPLTLIGTITAMIGWCAPLHWAHLIYDTAYNIAIKIASMPNADIIMPHIPNAAIALFILAGCAIMFIRARRAHHVICGICMATAITIIATQPRAAFFATYDHELVAFVKDENIEFNKARASNHFFAFDTWKQLTGNKTGTPNVRRPANHGVHIFETKNFTVAYVQKFVPLMREIAQLCRDDNIDYIVSYFDIRAPECNHKILRGGFVLYENGRVRHVTTDRLWHNRRG